MLSNHPSSSRLRNWPDYNQGGFALLGHNELTHLNLSNQELAQLPAFLKTLTRPTPTLN